MIHLPTPLLSLMDHPCLPGSPLMPQRVPSQEHQPTSDIGTIAVKITATDSGSASVNNTFNITVSANNAPTGLALSSNTASENVTGCDRNFGASMQTVTLSRIALHQG